jgi:DNA-directed RNA polymerase specialized sigma24 family protein
VRNRDPEDLWTDTESATWLKRSIRQRLSPFEWRVFRAYLDGMSYSEVADKLYCKVKSIDNALTRIRRKLAKVIVLPEARGRNGDRRMAGSPALVIRHEPPQAV